jgi:DNA-binding SARP family transcriptional activator
MLNQSPHGEVPSGNDGEYVVTGGDDHQIRLSLLDGFHLEQDGHPLSIPQSTRRVVAFLGLRGRSSRAEIAGTLWPDVPEAKAQASLRSALWRLRRLTSRPTVIVGHDALRLGATVSVDISTLVTTIRRVLDNSDLPRGSSPVPALAAVFELLPGWYDDWVLFERERLRQLQLHALEVIAERLTAAHRYGEAIEAALAAVRLEPLRESATRALITAHLAENNVVEAVRRFESFRQGLTSELGVQPTSELEQLVRSGLRRSAFPATCLGGHLVTRPAAVRQGSS